ncbi:hypothetical protein ABIA39_001569 [Nocardia sp. GAS34]|uniref:hypothetical protein n=1 Tax=unclassified Nocardia TaxID=2637762 RepID=UPI003D1FD7E4
MRLRLKYAPEPANAARFAADIAAAAANVSGVELDYTPDSLGHVDEIIEGFRSDRLSSDQVAETLFGFPMVMELPTGMVCNPIGKAFKRLDHGPEESVPYFYHVFTSERPGEV